MPHFKSVLIVEDNPQIRDVLKHLIEMEGYIVFIAENGLEALKKLAILDVANHPCLVLVDFMMPLMNGQELMEKMAEDDVLSTIPTVMVSANEPPPGVKRFVRKPYSVNAITSLLAEYCGK